MNTVNHRSKAHFETVSQGELPQGRRGKHHAFLSNLIDDLERLPEGRAIKIRMEDFPRSTTADLRSAISRATTQRAIEVATSSDEQFLYVWKPARERKGGAQDAG